MIDHSNAVTALVVCGIVFGALTYLIGMVISYNRGHETGRQQGYRDGFEDGQNDGAPPYAPYRTDHLEAALRNLVDAINDIHGNSDDLMRAIKNAEDLLNKTT